MLGKHFTTRNVAAPSEKIPVFAISSHYAAKVERAGKRIIRPYAGSAAERLKGKRKAPCPVLVAARRILGETCSGTGAGLDYLDGAFDSSYVIRAAFRDRRGARASVRALAFNGRPQG